MSKFIPTQACDVPGGVSNEIHAEQFPHTDRYPVNTEGAADWWDLPGAVPAAQQPVDLSGLAAALAKKA